MWLDPGCLPGPSLLDLTAANEVAIVGADLSEIEWHRPAREPSSTKAVRLVRLLRLDSDESAVVSVGDAEVLHTFLRDARRSSPSKIEERTALAALCRYLQSREWMPPHLASQYGLRAKVIEPPRAVEPKPEVAPREPPEALPPIEPSLLEVSMEPARRISSRRRSCSSPANEPSNRRKKQSRPMRGRRPSASPNWRRTRLGGRSYGSSARSRACPHPRPVSLRPRSPISPR